MLLQVRVLLLLPVCWYIFGAPSREPSLRHDQLAEAFIALMVVTAGGSGSTQTERHIES